jgi:hypothetical protein
MLVYVYERFCAQGIEFLKVSQFYVCERDWNNVLTVAEWYTHSQLYYLKKALQC